MTEDSRRDRPWLQGCVKCGSILHGGRYCLVPRKELKCEYCKTTGTHTTRQCQIMQSACLKCGYRGHGGGRCAGNRDIRKDFAKFEAFADEGERSRLRLEPNTWGYGFWFCSEDIGIRVYRSMVARDDPQGVLEDIETFKRLAVGRREMKNQVDRTCAQLWDMMEKRLSPPPRPSEAEEGTQPPPAADNATPTAAGNAADSAAANVDTVQAVADDMPDLESDEEDNTAGDAADEATSAQEQDEPADETAGTGTHVEEHVLEDSNADDGEEKV